jgi:uncharacterized membrane protein YphA (DoxX/SURF4 family)
MNTAIWIAQILLAIVFLLAGGIKVSQRKVTLRFKIGEWVDEVTDGFINFIGFFEILGAVGLILPMALNILPVLTPTAAAGLSISMIGAMMVHNRRKEKKELALAFVLFLLCLFVVIGRFKIVHF